MVGEFTETKEDMFARYLVLQKREYLTIISDTNDSYEKGMVKGFNGHDMELRREPIIGPWNGCGTSTP